MSIRFGDDAAIIQIAAGSQARRKALQCFVRESQLTQDQPLLALDCCEAGEGERFEDLERCLACRQGTLVIGEVAVCPGQSVETL